MIDSASLKMWFINTKTQRDEIENSRALVGTFVDRMYDKEKIEWLLDAKRGFDEHARDSWHLLVPVTIDRKFGYTFDFAINADNYGVELAADIIDYLQIEFSDLPCIVFRARGKNSSF